MAVAFVKGIQGEKVVATRRILRVKFWLGLFKDPYVDPEYAEKICGCEKHKKLALKTAREAIVLLKNELILRVTFTEVFETWPKYIKE